MIKLYLAGKITGEPDYREKFADAEKKLTAAGYTVINPATLPDGLTYHEYIRISTTMLDVCEAICLLPGWLDSPGACHEKQRAELCKLTIIFYEELQRITTINEWLSRDDIIKKKGQETLTNYMRGVE